jgi:hypothetical protein
MRLVWGIRVNVLIDIAHNFQGICDLWGAYLFADISMSRYGFCLIRVVVPKTNLRTPRFNAVSISLQRSHSFWGGFTFP